MHPVHVNVGHVQLFQTPVLQLLGVDLCDNPHLAHPMHGEIFL